MSKRAFWASPTLLFLHGNMALKGSDPELIRAQNQLDADLRRLACPLGDYAHASYRGTHFPGAWHEFAVCWPYGHGLKEGFGPSAPRGEMVEDRYLVKADRRFVRPKSIANRRGDALEAHQKRARNARGVYDLKKARGRVLVNVSGHKTTCKASGMKLTDFRGSNWYSVGLAPVYSLNGRLWAEIDYYAENEGV